MSESSITNKSNVIRNETQAKANTRGRVADVLDDINSTKANKIDVELSIDNIHEEQDIQNENIEDLNTKINNQESSIQNIELINTEQANQIESLQSDKLDKPIPPNNVNTKVILGDGTTTNLSNLTINLYNSNGVLSSNRTIDTATYSFVISNANLTAKLGINTSGTLTESLEVKGRGKMDGLILNTVSTSPIPGNFRSNSIGSAIFWTDYNSQEKQIAFVDIKPYKEILGYISQSGSDAPVLTVLRSDFTTSIFLARTAAGTYDLSIGGVFFDKSKIFFQNTPHWFKNETEPSLSGDAFLVFDLENSATGIVRFLNYKSAYQGSLMPEDGITFCSFYLRIEN